ncbi:MAG: Uma2 family endonuclease [Sumerlaeia bacterium]
MTVAATRARFGVQDYYKMIEAGVFEDRRVELLDGEIVEMSPSENPHHFTVHRIARLFRALEARHGLYTFVQSPFAIPDQASEPEPDLYVTRASLLDQAEQKAGPQDVLLLIEVADSSLRKDRMDKLPLYARAGIAEFWIVNLAEDCIEVYRSPDQAMGVYGEERIIARGEAICPKAFPEFSVAANVILPNRGDE